MFSEVIRSHSLEHFAILLHVAFDNSSTHAAAHEKLANERWDGVGRVGGEKGHREMRK